MKKAGRKLIALILCVIIALGSLMSLTPLFAVAVNYEVGDIIEYGNYPQSKVTDSDLIDELNSQDLKWVSYRYASENDKSNYMRYCDVVLNG